MSDQEPPRPSQPPGWGQPGYKAPPGWKAPPPPKTRSLWKTVLYIIAAGIALTLIRSLFVVMRDSF